MDELLINGENAYTTWGVRMGEGFLDVIGASASMKDFIENKSRLEHGKRVIINNPKVDEREITLSFTIESNSQSDYQAKKKAFFDELYKGEIVHLATGSLRHPLLSGSRGRLTEILY